MIHTHTHTHTHTEVEVLSLTNAQLVIDLYRVRQEKDHFHNLSEGHERMKVQKNKAILLIYLIYY
jgi:mannose/fructose-specific phosphotransferase system component IIA